MTFQSLWVILNMQLSDVERQTATSNFRTTTEQFRETQVWNELVPFLNSSNGCQNDFQETNNIVPLFTKTTPHIEERLVKDQQTHDLYPPLISTVLMVRKEEMLYVTLDFNNGLSIDAFVDSRVSVSATAHFEKDKIKQQAPINIFKVEYPLNFQIQVANGQLE